MVYKFFIVATVLWINVVDGVRRVGVGLGRERINQSANESVELLRMNNPVTYGELEFWERDPKFDTRRREKSKSNEQKTNHRGKTSKSTTGGYRKRTDKYASKSALRFQTKNSTIKNNNMNFRAKKFVSEDIPKSTRIDTNVDPKETTTSKVWTDQSKSANFRISPYAIAQQLTDITSKMPEANVTMEILGRTAEFSDIVLLKITEKKSEIDKYFRADDSKYIDDVPEKKIIFIVHALSVMGVNQMKVFQDNQLYTKLFSFYFAHLDKFDIFLIPMANPDGYAYVMNNKLHGVWNKNRSPQSGCAGVALDRNFDVKWNTTKPISACSQQYPGFTPFSEPETRAVREVLHKHSHKIIAYMHLHSGSYNKESFKGDAVLYPKGYSDVQTDDDRYIDLKGEIDEAIRNASFVNLSVAVDTLYNWYGKVFGTSVDYASSVYGIPYSMELVMQIYAEKNIYEVVDDQSVEVHALEHVWGTVIDVIFRNIWKSLHVNEVQ